jgi:hypothetical protein
VSIEAYILRSQGASLFFVTPDSAPHTAYRNVSASPVDMSQLLLAFRMSSLSADNAVAVRSANILDHSATV